MFLSPSKYPSMLFSDILGVNLLFVLPPRHKTVLSHHLASFEDKENGNVAEYFVPVNAHFIYLPSIIYLGND